MAGKEIYIGRMLEALETSMNNVSADMQTAAAILEKIYENQGIPKQQTTYSGATLAALDPDVESLYTPDLPTDERFVIDSTDKRLEVNAAISSGSIVEKMCYLEIPGELHRTQDIHYKVYYKFGNSSPYQMLSGPAFFGFYKNKAAAGAVYAEPTCYLNADSIPGDKRLEHEYTFEGTWTKKPDYDSDVFYIRCAFWNLSFSATNMEYYCEITDENGVSLWKTATLVNNDNVLGIDGKGSLIFSLSESSAVELSDALVNAALNEGDTIDLLDNNGDIVSADVGKEILLNDIAALSFKLRFNLTTGSTISAMAVRYY